MALNPGEVIVNRYKIVKKLGEGGFGAVYLAEDINLKGKLVALKENKTDPVNSALLSQSQAQFEREAYILSNLSHPNLPRVTDYQTLPSGMQFLVMDYIPGESLQTKVDRDGVMSEDDALSILIQVLDALIYLHGQTPQIIHRDIKPANIIVNSEGKAFLVDFGISKIDITLSGARGISPFYSPPEQYGAGTDQRSDIYSLGATLYFALTSSLPSESIERIINDKLVSMEILNPAISLKTVAAVHKAMSISINDRFANGEEFKLFLLTDSIGGFTSHLKQPEVLVAQDGSGHYLYISEAIKNSPPGSVIGIKPGMYNENISIQKNVELIGLGEKSEIIISGIELGPVMSVVNCSVIISNITFSSKDYFSPGLIFHDSFVKIQNVEVSGGYKLGIQFSDCKIFIEYCDIHECEEYGIAFFGTSKGIISKCRIFKNTNGGAYITGSAAPSFEQTFVYMNLGYGIVMSDNSRMDVTNCEIYGNQGGIFGKDNSKGMITKTKLVDNIEFGLFLDGNAEIESTSCEINSNGIDGVGIHSSSKLLMDSCVLRKNQRCGVSSFSSSYSDIIKCDLSQNYKGGLYLDDQSRIHISESSLLDNQWSGICQRKKSTLEVDNCKIMSNGSDGVILFEESSIMIRNCTISQNLMVGIRIGAKTFLEAHDCSIISNKDAGIASLQFASIRLFACLINSNMTGIQSAEDSKFYIELSEISQNHMCGGIFLNNSQLMILNSKIQYNQGSGLSIHDTCKIIIVGSTLRENEFGNYNKSDESIVEMSNCTFG